VIYIPTKCGDDWSNSNEMATVFFKIQDGGDRHLEFSQIYIFDVNDMFQIEVSMSSLILVTIGRKLKKWQQLFAIQDGGSRHLEKYTCG